MNKSENNKTDIGTIIARKDGQFYKVISKDGDSVLNALEKAGIKVTNHCRDGYCGACATKTVGGVSDIDIIEGKTAIGMTEPEEILLCVSEVCAGGKVKLDFDKKRKYSAS